MSGFQTATLRAIGEVTPGEWDALVRPDDPFQEHAFLAGLERCGAVGANAGWLPTHVVARRGGDLVAALPTYLRGDSWGEYVFDHGWANAAHRAGIRYYPKLSSAIPFTPSCPGRFLGDPAALPALVGAAEAAAKALGASSHHILFCSEGEAQALAELGYAVRLGFQFHWQDEGFGSFEGFLGRLQYKRRKELLRERRQVAEAGIVVEVLRGAEVAAADWAALERFYRFTHMQHGNPGYLPPEWWSTELPRLAHTALVVLARRDGQPVAGALNFVKGEAIYGRYWGATEEVKGLHFEVCYHALVDWGLKHGIRRVEAGAQGEHKLQRGFLPRFTYSAHRMQHPGLHAAVAEFCGREADAVRAAVQQYAAHGPYSPTSDAAASD